MNKIFIILSVLSLFSCSQTNEVKKLEPAIFYYSSYSSFNPVRNKISETFWHHDQDTLLASVSFSFRDTMHEIRMFTNDYIAADDGGELMYELDSIGIFYQRSTTWKSYSRLHSNKDSINAILEVALENIILNQDLHCYQCRQYYMMHPNLDR